MCQSHSARTWHYAHLPTSQPPIAHESAHSSPNHCQALPTPKRLADHPACTQPNQLRDTQATRKPREQWKEWSDLPKHGCSSSHGWPYHTNNTTPTPYEIIRNHAAASFWFQDRIPQLGLNHVSSAPPACQVPTACVCYLLSSWEFQDARMRPTIRETHHHCSLQRIRAAHKVQALDSGCGCALLACRGWVGAGGGGRGQPEHSLLAATPPQLPKACREVHYGCFTHCMPGTSCPRAGSSEQGRRSCRSGGRSYTSGAWRRWGWEASAPGWSGPQGRPSQRAGTRRAG